MDRLAFFLINYVPSGFHNPVLSTALLWLILMLQAKIGKYISSLSLLNFFLISNKFIEKVSRDDTHVPFSFKVKLSIFLLLSDDTIIPNRVTIQD